MLLVPNAPIITTLPFRLVKLLKWNKERESELFGFDRSIHKVGRYKLLYL